MNEKLLALWETAKQKAAENKELLIRIGIGLTGAAIGAVVATALSGNSDLDPMFFEEDETQVDEPMSITDAD